MSAAIFGADTGSAADTFNLRAAPRQFFFQSLEAAIQMINAVDHGFALGRQTGDHQRNRRAQVGCHDLCALQALDAFDGRGLAGKRNPCPETRQFLHMHEAVFKMVSVMREVPLALVIRPMNCA